MLAQLTDCHSGVFAPFTDRNHIGFMLDPIALGTVVAVDRACQCKAAIGNVQLITSYRSSNV